jgi:hypothetical protein
MRSFINFCLYNDKVKEGVMDRSCNTYGKEEQQGSGGEARKKEIIKT